MTLTRPPPRASRAWMWQAPEGILEMSILHLLRIAFARAIRQRESRAWQATQRQGLRRLPCATLWRRRGSNLFSQRAASAHSDAIAGPGQLLQRGAWHRLLSGRGRTHRGVSQQAILSLRINDS